MNGSTAGDCDVLVPSTSVAWLRKRSVPPTSASVTVYVAAVAPGMSTQFAPVWSHRTQRRSTDGAAGVTLHVALVPVSTDPGVGAPLTVGTEVAQGLSLVSVRLYPAQLVLAATVCTTTAKG